MKQRIIFFILLSCALLLVYIPSLQNDFTYLDDQVQIVNNSTIKSLTVGNLGQIFSSTSVGMYQPLTTTLYALIYQFFELNAMGYHFASLLFHFMNCFLVFQLLKKLKVNEKIIFLLLSIFALHPMQVESIAWVSAFSNLVYTSFYLLSYIAYINFHSKRNQKDLGLTYLFFILACLSKSAAVTLPLVLLAYDLYSSGTLSKINWLNKLPFIAISILFGLITLFSRESAGHLSDLSIQFNGFERLFLICYSVLFYPFKLILPAQLSAFYPYPEIVDGALPVHYYLSAALLLLIGFLVWKFRKQATLWFGVVFFLLTISLVLQFIPVGNQLTTDRYIYLPMIGLLLIAAQLLKSYAQKKGVLLLFLLPLILAFQSHERAKIWSSDQSIWEDVILNYPNVAQAYNNLGSYVLLSNDKEKALDYFNQAIKLKPYYADAYSNRGNLLAQKGDSKSAIRDYSTAIQLRPHADAYFNRANEFSKLNDLNSAIADYTASIQLQLTADALTNRAFAYLKQQQTTKAKKDLEHSIEKFSNYDRAYYLLAMIYSNQNDKNSACLFLNKAIKLGNPQARGAYQQICL